MTMRQIASGARCNDIVRRCGDSVDDRAAVSVYDAVDRYDADTASATATATAALCPERRALAAQLSADSLVALELVGDDAVSRWHGIMGPSNPADARAAAPASLRARFGTSAASNATYGSATAEAATAEIDFLFNSGLGYSADCSPGCSLMVVKPHCVAARGLGTVVQELLAAGVTIAGLRSLQLTRQDAEDFLEVYKGVVPEYARYVASRTPLLSCRRVSSRPQSSTPRFTSRSRRFVSHLDASALSSPAPFTCLPLLLHLFPDGLRSCRRALRRRCCFAVAPTSSGGCGTSAARTSLTSRDTCVQSHCAPSTASMALGTPCTAQTCRWTAR